MTEEFLTFYEFLNAVTARTGDRVDQLVFANRPVCSIERSSFSDSGKILREKFACISGGHSALVETDIDTVRVSFALDKDQEDRLSLAVCRMFYARLARETLPFVRKQPLPGYQVSCLFSHEEKGADVRRLLTETCVRWRGLVRLIRLRQMIGHGKAGLSLWRPFVARADMVQEEVDKGEQNQEESAVGSTPPEVDCWSVGTDIGRLDQLGTMDELATMEDPQEIAASSFLLISN